MQRRNQLLAGFHLQLAEIVGNSVLTAMLHELLARTAVITVMYQSAHDASCSSQEHYAFLAAARDGDAERACALMDEHLLHLQTALDFDGAPALTAIWWPPCSVERPFAPDHGPSVREGLLCRILLPAWTFV